MMLLFNATISLILCTYLDTQNLLCEDLYLTQNVGFRIYCYYESSSIDITAPYYSILAISSCIGFFSLCFMIIGISKQRRYQSYLE